MSKNYNIEKKSDMKHFHQDMMNKIESVAEEKTKSIYAEQTQDIGFYENVFPGLKVECPNCHNKVPSKMGYSQCPICQGTICVTSETVRFR
ncbi:MAG: hypothetical protein HDQ97_12100 [Lachnospiraceae bacterium]|nr:hypothetical protein [Lachnospiraceae bacterium]